MVLSAGLVDKPFFNLLVTCNFWAGGNFATEAAVERRSLSQSSDELDALSHDGKICTRGSREYPIR